MALYLRLEKIVKNSELNMLVLSFLLSHTLCNINIFDDTNNDVAKLPSFNEKL